MVSSSVGSESSRTAETKSQLISTPAARMSSCSLLNVATSSPVDRSAVFMRLWYAEAMSGTCTTTSDAGLLAQLKRQPAA